MLHINNIYNMDCVEGMIEIPSNYLSLCITSPPYKNSDGYRDDLMNKCFRELYRILKPNSLFFLNFGHLVEDKFRPFMACRIAMDYGFKLNDTITWTKNHYKPIQGNKRLNNLTEFIFLLYKGEMPNLNRLSIGIEYKDKSNINRFAKGKDLKCRGNNWFIKYETIQSSKEKYHNDRFPLELPELCIKLSGIKNGILIDPFMGSGTSAIAAKKYGLDYIGFEHNQDHIKIAQQRLESLV